MTPHPFVQRWAEAISELRDLRAAALLRLLNRETPGDWQIIATPKELQFPLAVTAELMVGTIKLSVTRSGGRQRSSSCQWDVRIRHGGAELVGGAIVFLASGVSGSVRRAAQVAVRHDPKCEPPAWCNDDAQEQSVLRGKAE